MSDGTNGASPAPETTVLLAIHRNVAGQLSMQSTLSPMELLQLLGQVAEDVRYQAYQQRSHHERNTAREAVMLGNMGELLKKVPR